MEHAAVTYKWVVYLVRCADGTLYCGVTTDMERRLGEHNRGRGARYTRSRRPVTLVATAPFPDRSTAQKAEHHVKRLPPDRKQEALARYASALPVAARPSAPRTKE